MLAISEPAVAAIRHLTRAADTSTARIRTVSGGPPPAVRLDPDAEPGPDDVIMARHGVTVVADRSLAAAVSGSTLHAEPAGDGTVVFSLVPSTDGDRR